MHNFFCRLNIKASCNLDHNEELRNLPLNNVFGHARHRKNKRGVVEVRHNLLIILVTSNAKNYDLRKAQREAFNETFLHSLGMKRIFLLFTDNVHAPQHLIEEENKRYQDILQGSMQEGYKNLAFKHLMGLQWIANECKSYR